MVGSAVDRVAGDRSSDVGPDRVSPRRRACSGRSLRGQGEIEAGAESGDDARQKETLVTIRAGRRRADHLQSGAAGGGDHHGGVAHREAPALGGDRAAKLDVTANAVKGTIAMTRT